MNLLDALQLLQDRESGMTGAIAPEEEVTPQPRTATTLSQLFSNAGLPNPMEQMERESQMNPLDLLQDRLTRVIDPLAQAKGVAQDVASEAFPSIVSPSTYQEGDFARWLESRKGQGGRAVLETAPEIIENLSLLPVAGLGVKAVTGVGRAVAPALTYLARMAASGIGGAAARNPTMALITAYLAGQGIGGAMEGGDQTASAITDLPRTDRGGRPTAMGAKPRTATQQLEEMLQSRKFKLGAGEELPESFGRGFSRAAAGTSERASRNMDFIDERGISMDRDTRVAQLQALIKNRPDIANLIPKFYQQAQSIRSGRGMESITASATARLNEMLKQEGNKNLTKQEKDAILRQLIDDEVNSSAARMTADPDTLANLATMDPAIARAIGVRRGAEAVPSSASQTPEAVDTESGTSTGEFAALAALLAALYAGSRTGAGKQLLSKIPEYLKTSKGAASKVTAATPAVTSSAATTADDAAAALANTVQGIVSTPSKSPTIDLTRTLTNLDKERILKALNSASGSVDDTIKSKDISALMREVKDELLSQPGRKMGESDRLRFLGQIADAAREEDPVLKAINENAKDAVSSALRGLKRRGAPPF